MSKLKRLVIEVTKDERAFLRALAHTKGETLRTWIRHKLGLSLKQKKVDAA